MFANIEKAVEENDTQLLIESVILVGDIYYDGSNVANAVFAFNEARIMCELLKITKFLPEILIGIGNCCIRVKKYDYALLFFKKAL